MSEKQPILIIEDDPLIRSGLACFLEEEGYKILSAENGLVGLEILRKERVSLVLLDLQMPVMSGEEFLTALKLEENPEMRSVPVLVLTARVEGINNDGIAGFIRKPLDLFDLLAKVQEFTMVESN